MYDLERLKKELKELSESQGDTFSIPVSLNNRLTKTLGRVTSKHIGKQWYPQKMEFSKMLLETSTDESVRSVLEHEWCHYYVTKLTKESHGHDHVFKDMCAQIGCTNDKTTTKVERSVADMSKYYKYSIYCPNCGMIGGRQKSSYYLKNNMKGCSCKQCGSEDLWVEQNW